MSMIEVKGTKTGTTETVPAQRYALRSTLRESAAPLYFGMFLTGLVFYLKSLFTDSSETQSREDSSENRRAAEEESVLVASVASEKISRGQSGQPDEEHTVKGGGGSVANPFLIRQYAPAEGAVYQDKTAHHLPGERFAPSGALLSANDNVPEAAPNHSTPAPASAKRVDEPEEQEEDDGESSTINRAPRVSGPVYLADVVGCGGLFIALSDLLRNALDPDGDALTVRNFTLSSGALIRSGDGWVFHPSALGEVIITYEITDGYNSVQQTARFSVLEQPAIIGTQGDDTLLGSMCGDEIDGRDGNDIVDGRAGDDLIMGGAGNDHIVAGSGNDTVFGGTGSDIILGGYGNDRISGDGGHDRLFGESGNDTIWGGDGNDLLVGGDGDDLLFGDDGNDVVHGDLGRDMLEGGRGNDELFGGTGNDMIAGGDGDDLLEGNHGDDILMDGAGADTVRGGEGDDIFVATPDGKSDIFDGGADEDTLDYSGASSDLEIDLVEGTASGEDIGDDCVKDIERVIGGEGDDHIIVGDTSVSLEGRGGEDTFDFTVPDASQDTLLLHEIVDFKAGDRIRMSKYDIFEEVVDELEDEFEKIYGDEVDEDDATIRYRHDERDEVYRTIIEADFNNDDIYELVIELQGHHALVMVGTV